jgi:hypothetical protein
MGVKNCKDCPYCVEKGGIMNIGKWCKKFKTEVSNSKPAYDWARRNIK